MAEASVIRMKACYYIHVLDNNTNVTRVVSGPLTFTRQDHEKVVEGPTAMITIHPRHYICIQNPVVRDSKGQVITQENGQVVLRHGDEEIRFDGEPFPLYPGEKIKGKMTPLKVVSPNYALRIKCVRDFVDEDGNKRVAGDEWLFKGPGTYTPRIEEDCIDKEPIQARIIGPNQALRLKALRDCTDSNGIKRFTGEEWLIRTLGAYMPSVEEEVVDTLNANVLTDRKALHLRATQTFVDVFKVTRKAGTEWLVTMDMCETHILDIYEEKVADVKLNSLTNRQFCVVLDPWVNDKQLLGHRQLRKGECSFFLKPGERLENGVIQNVYVLQEDEALLLKSIEPFMDGKTNRRPGDLWLLYGPIEYIPPIEVVVLETRKAIPLDENEGIYVRDLNEGSVRIVTKDSYMLKPHEEKWEKELPKAVEELLSKDSPADIQRDRTRVVTYRAPHNSAVQIYDYKAKLARIVFGPELIMLGPDEHFTILSLSGEQPKRPNVIKALSLLLGPDFMTDIVIVETSDHARLSLKLSYNWHFEFDKKKPEDAHRLFQVPDFVGDSCKAMASRVRATVASKTFDVFHRDSSEIIRSAVFGKDHENQPKNKFQFSANNLVITNIDIQSVEPVDQRTRDSLQKSVQLAIDLATKAQELTARHENSKLEQIEIARFEEQKIKDKIEAEHGKKKLAELTTETQVVEQTGLARAQAQAKAEKTKIEGEASVTQAKLATEALKLQNVAELERIKASQNAEISHQKSLIELELQKAKELANIEAEKFSQIVKALGPETIKSMAESGPATQAKLLQGLGLQSFLITDGNSPINLFNTAQGLIGGKQ